MESRIPVNCKLLLTVEEASEYTNIGVNRLRDLLYAPDCPFALYITSSRALIKRKALEEYIESRVKLA